jgi:hypothetical protein
MERHTEIVAILDRSGSMASIREDAIGGFNSFLEDQQAVPGEARFTLVQFDNVYEVVYDAVDLRQVSPLSHGTFVPRGATALLDAVGRTIDDVGRRLHATPESQRPAHVIVAILTDGMENASTDYTLEQVRTLIDQQQTVYGWDFIYLGANQDAIRVGQSLSIAAKDSYQWTSDAAGTAALYCQVSKEVTARRTTPRTERHQDTKGKSRRVKRGRRGRKGTSSNS